MATFGHGSRWFENHFGFLEAQEAVKQNIQEAFARRPSPRRGDMRLPMSCASCAAFRRAAS
eukprot:8369853-Pyramimonas_sp.AAC.1